MGKILIVENIFLRKNFQQNYIRILVNRYSILLFSFFFPDYDELPIACTGRLVANILRLHDVKEVLSILRFS